jgi:2-polyprenyl-3-methyl-5-hydroxy-6-metoxy-1,4-benzoquinol methylase/GNAT superfamily N-acetyltransferase
MYEFHWTHGPLVNSDLISAMSSLYSAHYGHFGQCGPRPGQPIRLSPEQVRRWLSAESLVVWAEAFGEMVGYAIAIHANVPEHGNVAWITQLVVHRDHRKVDVGKRLLFTIWQFSDYFAWGLLSANPYAIRALEKATRRRCQPQHIAKYASKLIALGAKQVHYLDVLKELSISENELRINTGFNLDHSELAEMLSSATSDTKPWVMGPLPEGWEWFAFTFHDQEQIPLAERELEEMLLASDKITKQAYARMQSHWGAHPWARFAAEEVEFMLRYSGVPRGSNVLDFGCGNGRHASEFAKDGYHVTAVDYVHESVEMAYQSLEDYKSFSIRFHNGDCREVDFGKRFELGVCLYDVIGSHADDHANSEILKNLARHIVDGGYVFLSVMNMELTERLAKSWFSVASEADRLLSLRPSTIMERSGDVFNPDYYLIDRDKRVVYRKEQFRRGEELFEELLVRDRRYTIEEISVMCVAVGLEVIWTRLVRAGHWEEPLSRDSGKAKEILVMCRKPYPKALQQRLF